MATHRGTFHPIQRRGRKWVVVARHSGRVLGTHDTYEDALAQLRAVEVHQHGVRRNPPKIKRIDYEKGQWIDIYENGKWAGRGILRNGRIEDIAAVLGDNQDMSDEAYDEIDSAIARGDEEVSIGPYVWEWEIEDEDS